MLGCVFRSPTGFGTAAGGAAMGHPAAALAWLVGRWPRATSGSNGTSCSPAGSPPSVPLRAGEPVIAEFDGLGPVEVRGG